MSRYRKFTTICCAAVFALGLAACGGGGNDGLNTSQEQMLQEQVATLQGQINALRAQLGLAADDNLGDSIESLQMEVARLQMEIQDAKDAADAAARKAMVATAAKLYAGIGSAPLTSTGDGQRSAAYSGTSDAQITLTIDDAAPGDGTDTTVTLSEDKKTAVAANHGWAGKRYADPPGGDMVEAMVYSDVEAPKQGKKFGSAAVVPNDNFQYQLTNGALIQAQLTGAPANVSLSRVTRTAGTETFKLPDSNPNGETIITEPGSFHGVTGTYSCDTGDGTSTCTATVAAKGFALGGTGTWTFKPGDANARVMSAADTAYASYGWWIHKSADGKTFIASAFSDYKGGDDSAELAGGLDALNGTAMYMGGAAGKYALSSPTGGTNDAGHFTARAMFEADFTNNTTATAISGTIDNFMGADGEARNWSVKLNASAITNGGVIGGATSKTEWTIDGTAAADAGQWSGQFYNNGTDNVPKAAAGTFHSEYGTAGRMVGAFGVNKQ